MFGNGKLRCKLVGKHFIHSISEEVFSQEVSSLNTENCGLRPELLGIILAALIIASPV